MRRKSIGCGCALVLATLTAARADGPRDNLPAAVRPIPPVGIEVPAADRQALEAGVAAIEQAVVRIRALPEPGLSSLWPDVAIFSRAVRDALAYRELFTPQDVKKARRLLQEAALRAEQIERAAPRWTNQPGLVVRGYVSRIDGSVQPYGLVIPQSYSGAGGPKHRLDVWLHGRGETLSEVNFLDQRQTQVGQFAPPDTIVLHPYGRYCNAFKFAGEIDVLEALDSARSRYPIDDDRIAVRGFSMGGAACWQLAVHYAGLWCAANPGAGFAETAQFLRVFQTEQVQPTWYERALWHWYDCPDWAGNLYHLPTVAYSGELDKQKQAADVMQQALSQLGIDLVHIIGPGTQHKYHPQSAIEVDKRLASIVERGRDRLPRTVHFTTYTLRYPKLAWIEVSGLEEHWIEAQVNARIIGDRRVAADTKNVTDLAFSIPPGWSPFEVSQPVHVSLDGQDVAGPRPMSDRSWTAAFHRAGGKWQLGARPRRGLRKAPGLQGPIDDAFLDSFIFVRPSGKCASPQVDAWVHAEMDRAIREWRRQFRGDARVKLDTELTPADIESSNLCVWGDAQANRVLAKMAEKLPLGYEGESLVVGESKFAAAHHAPILIYPNLLNPSRYLVVNSGFTYREYDYLNNARQVPKLPDWAVVDLRTPPDSRWPGKIAAAGFFDEVWQLKKHDPSSEEQASRPENSNPMNSAP